MAGSDHLCRFCCAYVKPPGNTSDYLAFTTSPLGLKLEQENKNIVKKGYTIVRDNTWVPRPWIATPIYGHCITVNDDACNFYYSQVWIMIEHMFGIFVHRWGILRMPLLISMLKVPPFVIALMRLCNSCINSKFRATLTTLDIDERRIRWMAATHGNTEQQVMYIPKLCREQLIFVWIAQRHSS